MFLVPSLADRPKAQEADSLEAIPYIDQLNVNREEYLLQREIRKFRTYPHLDRAYRLLDAGRLQEARAELEKYLTIDPADSRVRASYLILLHQLKDYQQVISQADLIIRAQPSFVTALQYRALAYLSLNQPDKAIQDFQSILSLDSAKEEDKRFAGNMVADLAIKQKSYSEALEALARTVKLGEDFSLYFRQGISLQALDRLAEAQAAYRVALTLASHPEEQLLGSRALGMVAHKRQDWEVAEEAFGATLKLDPGNRAIIRALAYVAYGQEDYEQAIRLMREMRPFADPTEREFLANLLYSQKDYRSALVEYAHLLAEFETDDDRYRIYNALGNTYTHLGRFDRAAEAFRGTVEIKSDVTALASLAQALEQAGRLREAIQIHEKLLTVDPSAQTKLTLGLLYARTGDYRNSLPHLEAAIQSDLSAPQKRIAYQQRIFIYDKLGENTQTRRALEKAIAMNPRDYSLYISLGEICIRLGDSTAAIENFKRSLDIRETAQAWRGLINIQMRERNWEEAAKSSHHLLSLRDFSSDQSAEALENLGLIYRQLDQDEQAVKAFKRAIEKGRNNSSIRHNLGLTLMALGRWSEALQQFNLALRQERSARSFLYVARCYAKMDKPDLAIEYYRHALPHLEQLAELEEKQFYDELGYLYATQSKYADAVKAFQRSLAIQEDPATVVRLGRLQRLQGREEDARRTLEALTPVEIPPELEAAQLDELAQVYSKEDQFEKAISAIKQANNVDGPTAARDHTLGQLYWKEKRIDEAIPHFEAAFEQETSNNDYAAALGYAYQAADQFNDAAPLFESVIEREPDRLSLYKELGYGYLRSANNAKAAYWFKEAIDRQLDDSDSIKESSDERDHDIYGLRQEINTLNNYFDLTVYQSFRSNDNSQTTSPGDLGGGVPSQGGVEFAYRPPVIGLRDNRVLQLFSRLLWSNENRSLSIDEETLQGGIGVRYKPLKTHNLYVSAEKLFKIGEQSDDNWLLRTAYSWSNGLGLKPGESSWNYSLFYGDLSFFLDSPFTWAYYGEGRQGWTFNFRDTFLISPHMVLDGRHQDPDPGDVSYLELGAGISLRYLFNDIRYETHRSNIEFLMQYKGGLIGADSGLVLTAVLSF